MTFELPSTVSTNGQHHQLQQLEQLTVDELANYVEEQTNRNVADETHEADLNVLQSSLYVQSQNIDLHWACVCGDNHRVPDLIKRGAYPS